jgi:hypothetical protein
MEHDKCRTTRPIDDKCLRSIDRMQGTITHIAILDPVLRRHLCSKHRGLLLILYKFARLGITPRNGSMGMKPSIMYLVNCTVSMIWMDMAKNIMRAVVARIMEIMDALISRRDMDTLNL